jgi:coproporphyrinogen III oxidase
MKINYTYIQNLQDQIVGLEAVRSAKFREDLWERPEGGGGRTRCNGNNIEKAVSIFQQCTENYPAKDVQCR